MAHEKRLNRTTARLDSMDSRRVTFSPQSTQSMNAFYEKYMRRNVVLNLRSSAFICGFKLLWLFSLLTPRRA
jgi:hypothetical protein